MRIQSRDGATEMMRKAVSAVPREEWPVERQTHTTILIRDMGIWPVHAHRGYAGDPPDFADERASVAADRGMPDHEDMNTVADLRVGRSPYAAVVAAAWAFVPITLVAWASWQAIEGDRNTLLRSQFSLWAWVTFGTAVLTCVAGGVFWRSPKARMGVALGALLAGLAVAGGLVVDIVGSGGLA